MRGSEDKGEWVPGICPRCNGNGGCPRKTGCDRGEVMVWVEPEPEDVEAPDWMEPDL